MPTKKRVLSKAELEQRAAQVLPKDFGKWSPKLEDDPHYQIGYERGACDALAQILMIQTILLRQKSSSEK